MTFVTTHSYALHVLSCIMNDNQPVNVLDSDSDSGESSEGQEPVTSSYLVEIKDLKAKLKYSVEQLDFISVAAANAREELLKLKKILKPRTCPCHRTCTCKACNDLDSCFRDVQEFIQAMNFNNHIGAVERNFHHINAAYRQYKIAHAHDWNI